MLTQKIRLDTKDRFPSLNSKPGVISFVFFEGLTLGSHPFNDSAAGSFVGPGDSTLISSDGLNSSRFSDVRVNDISNLLGSVQVCLREWKYFDFHECANFAKFNVPVTKRNSSGGLLVNKSYSGG